MAKWTRAAGTYVKGVGSSACVFRTGSDGSGAPGAGRRRSRSQGLPASRTVQTFDQTFDQTFERAHWVAAARSEAVFAAVPQAAALPAGEGSVRLTPMVMTTTMVMLITAPPYQ